MLIMVFGVKASNHGLEQPVWDAKTGKFYLAVPGALENPAGEIDEIDPAGQLITGIFPTTCSPAGLVLVPRHRLVTSCGDVINIASGKVLTTVAPVGRRDLVQPRRGTRVLRGGSSDPSPNLQHG